MVVHDLPPNKRLSMLRSAAHDAVTGGRIYDSHIADVARAVGAGVVVTDNRRYMCPRCATTCASRRRLS